MTTNQLTTCSSTTLLPARTLPSAGFVPFLTAALPITRGVDPVDAVAGDPWSLVRNIRSGPRVLLGYRDRTVRTSFGATGDRRDVARLACASGCRR